jgi:hypothetical protein
MTKLVRVTAVESDFQWLLERLSQLYRAVGFQKPLKLEHGHFNRLVACVVASEIVSWTRLRQILR